jgi:hypothetical protein
MPVTPDGKVPNWWFGTWNPLHWFAHLFRLPADLRIGSCKIRLQPGDDFIWPWRAKAPLRAQMRYIMGLDGTFIHIRSMKRKRAEKLARPETER